MLPGALCRPFWVILPNLVVYIFLRFSLFFSHISPCFYCLLLHQNVPYGGTFRIYSKLTLKSFFCKESCKIRSQFNVARCIMWLSIDQHVALKRKSLMNKKNSYFSDHFRSILMLPGALCEPTRGIEKKIPCGLKKAELINQGWNSNWRLNMWIEQLPLKFSWSLLCVAQIFQAWLGEKRINWLQSIDSSKWLCPKISSFPCCEQS